MNPFSTLVESIKLMQTKKDLRFCIANLCDELPVVSKIKRWATSGKLILFYNASNASQWWRHKFCAAWLDLAIWLDEILIRACWWCRHLSLRRFSQHLLEIFSCRFIDPQIVALTSCWLIALDCLRSPLVQRLVSLSKAWGTVECPFFVLATIWGLPYGIYFVLDLISSKLSLAGAWMASWGCNDDQPWLTWLTWWCIVNWRELLRFYDEYLKYKGWWTWGIFFSGRTPLFQHLESRNHWSWWLTCDRPSGLSAQPSAAAITIFAWEIDWEVHFMVHLL